MLTLPLFLEVKFLDRYGFKAVIDRSNRDILGWLMLFLGQLIKHFFKKVLVRLFLFKVLHALKYDIS